MDSSNEAMAYGLRGPPRVAKSAPTRAGISCSNSGGGCRVSVERIADAGVGKTRASRSAQTAAYALATGSGVVPSSPTFRNARGAAIFPESGMGLSAHDEPRR